MLRKELLIKLENMENVHIYADEIYDIIGYPAKDHSKYDPAHDYRFQKELRYVNKAEPEFYEIMAFAIICNLSAYSLHPAAPRQLQHIMDILGYTAEDMEKYTASKADRYATCIRSHNLIPLVFILARSLAEFLRKKTKQKDMPFHQIIVYLQEEKLLTLDEIELSKEAYEEFVIENIKICSLADIQEYELNEMVNKIQKYTTKLDTKCSNFIRDYLKKTPKLSSSNPLLVSPLKNPDLDHILEATEEMLANAERQLPKEQRKFIEESNKKINQLFKLRDQIIQQERDNLHNKLLKFNDYRENDAFIIDIAEGALLELLEGDDIYQIEFGKRLYAQMLLISNIPFRVSEMPALSDEDEWNDYYSDMNGKLGSKVYNSFDYVELPAPDEDSLEGVRIPVSALLSYYSNYVAPSDLFIRRSHIRAFQSLGFSARIARDLAVAAATLTDVRIKSNDDFLYDIYPSHDTEQPVIQNKSPAEIEKVKLLETKLEQTLHDLKVERENAQSYRHEFMQLQKQIEELKKENARLSQAPYSPSEKIKTVPSHSEFQEILYPFHTNLKVVLFGGFDVFHKELKKLLPDVRIVEISTRIDLEPIRNADIVFLQVNRTNHSNYWNVRDTCKANHIPCFHIRYASAKRCADFMVQEIQKQESN